MAMLSAVVFVGVRRHENCQHFLKYEEKQVILRGWQTQRDDGNRLYIKHLSVDYLLPYSENVS